MKKWIHTSAALLAASTLAISSAEAQYENNPFDASYCGCGFEMGIDFLWWKQSVDNLDFGSCTTPGTFIAGQDKDGADVERNCITYSTNTLCPKWKPGVRAQIAFRNFLPNANLRGSYTFIRHSDAGTFSGSPVVSLIPTQRDYEVVSSEWKSTYQAADLLFTFPICSNPCFNAMPFFGVEGIYVKQELKSNLSNPFNYSYLDINSCFKGHVWGVGLKVGSDYDYTLTSCLKFFGRGSLSIISGTPSTQHIFKDDEFCENTFRVEFCDKGCQCHMMPGFHLQSGFRYLASLCGTTIDLHVGYEFVEWLNVPNTKHFVGEIFSKKPLVSATRTGRNLGFNGLFIGANVAF